MAVVRFRLLTRTAIRPRQQATAYHLPLASFSDYLWPLTDPPTLTSSVPFPQAIPITDNAFWEQIFEAPGDKAEKYYGRTVSAAMRTSDPASPSPFLAAVNSQQSLRG